MSAARSRGAAALGVAFVLPTVALIVFCGIVPIAAGIGYSLSRWDGIRPPVFVGLENYVTALTRDDVNRRAMANTLTLTAACLSLQVFLGYSAANLLYRLKGAAAEAGKVVLFIPYVLSFAAVGVLFSFIFASSELGLVNKLLGLFGIKPFPWFGSVATAKPAVILTYAWKDFGFAMILYYAGLQAIPVSLIEAAEIDGARAFQITRFVKLPSLRPVTEAVVVLAAVHYMLTFTIIIFLTPDGGVERSTEVVATWFYKQSFQFLELGYGASLAVILAVAVLAVTLVLRRVAAPRPDA
jgi:multiple sugar transport system permease protein